MALALKGISYIVFTNQSGVTIMLNKFLWIFVGLFLAFGNANASPVLLVDSGGKLTGANGVDVGGTAYDVRFVDGRCMDIFSGCDSVADFDFSTSFAAGVASQALLDQVFVDGSLGNFDTNPALTLGCSASNGCYVATPYNTFETFVWDAFVVAAINAPADGDDAVSFGGLIFADSDLSSSQQGGDGAVFAVWTLAPAPTPVPEPSSLALVGLALAGLGFRRSRKA